MARTRDQAAAVQLGETLSSLRESADSPSFSQIQMLLYSHIGHDRITPSDDWIRQAHNGDIDPWTADLAYVDALARFYGVNPAELHPAIEARLAVIGREWSGRERPPVIAMERRRQPVKTVAKTKRSPGRGTQGDGTSACTVIRLADRRQAENALSELPLAA